jgi:hypothetical protein
MRFYVRFETCYRQNLTELYLNTFFCLVKTNLKKPNQKQRKQKGINVLTGKQFGTIWQWLLQTRGTPEK